VVEENLFDPYNQNTYKGDRPINRREARAVAADQGGDDWFFVANLIRHRGTSRAPSPSRWACRPPSDPDSLDVFGNDSYVFSRPSSPAFALLKGSTAFKPPSIEYRVTLAYNVNYVDVPERRVLFVEPSRPATGSTISSGVQEAFVDYHFSKFDNDRYRLHLDPRGHPAVPGDFRGFLFNDSSWACACSATATTTASSSTSRPSGGWRRTPIRASTRGRARATTGVRRQPLSPGFPDPGADQPGHRGLQHATASADDVEIDDNGFPVRPALLGTLARARI
jgi:hypothetical protein